MSIPDTDDPIALFGEWYDRTLNAGIKNPTAVTLATVDATGRPAARMVLLKGFDERGFVFYTNTESRKGEALAANPHAALCFYWSSSDRQVRIEGDVNLVDADEADEYFASRPRESQIGAWASDQSRPLASKFDFEKRIAKFALKFGVGTVPRPPHWTGFRISPTRIEFWQEGAFRLHDRLLFLRAANGWARERLFP